MSNNQFLPSFNLEQEFKNALIHGELSLLYQPIVDLEKGTIVGFEALMRWAHSTRGNIPPNVFIPIASETGLILDASKWALKEACHALKRIERHVGQNKNLYMSVNFTAHDFSDDTFLDYLYDTISASDILPSQIQLELTEELLMIDPATARDSLAFCRKAGIKIALDDFGVGDASINFVQDFPIDAIKLDRGFLKTLQTDSKNPSLTIGERRDIRMIAEGIEDFDEMTFVKNLGCDTAQGYYFSHPITEKDAAKLLLTDYIFIKKLETA